jgi:hypothetical protein
MSVILQLDFGIQPGLGDELLSVAYNYYNYIFTCCHSQFIINFEVGITDFDCELLGSVEAKCISTFAWSEFQWQDAHANQVASVDPLERLGDHSSNSQQIRTSDYI